MKYHLVAKDEKTGKPLLWGFDFGSLSAAKSALLPGTWVIDDDGFKVAERALEDCA